MTPAQLQDRIEQLEAVLGADRSLTGQLRDLLEIEPRKAEIVGMLYSRAFVSRDGLYTVLYESKPESEWPDEKVLDVQICRLRPHLEKHGLEIETRWGDGWSMPNESKQKLKIMLGGLAGGLSKARQIKADPIKSAQITDLEQFKMWGSMGGKKGSKRRMKVMKKKERQRVASHAARMRWAKRA